MTPDRRLSVAPMMDWTDRHCRYFHRLLAPQALLYTEMLTTGALMHGDRARLLAFDPAESPVALQLGGSEPDDLAACARMAEAEGYAEVNLNCGCPSERVQRGAFGACLMCEPGLVADCVAAMRAATGLPVTVKCRIGVDDSEEWDFLLAFVDRVAEAGCRVFAVHARKAWLKGLSPKENREVPPLRYEVVERLKTERPDLDVVVNGGVTTAGQALAHLRWADGVMIGREAYQNPWSLRAFAEAAHGPQPALARADVVEAMAAYAARRQDVPLRAIARHMLGLFNGLPGARAWRRTLSEGVQDADAGPELLGLAMRAVRPGLRLAA
ncbi:MAG TPA: tRNA dihydrouridine(20/20a) synthase DusA [Geminicoccaceae bacterium]|nr:tRNA dihydrouridine(20/20a) synthase DusA [Geminicoccus sp.]HMU52868.1 tRNA dihydrouridine(20/20a) synthase DusA [Geminicoccaceae bacterium]